MKKIILVEDDESLYRMYSTELELRGYTIIWVNKGNDVMPTVLKEKPDLVFLDIMLPEKDGLTILQELKQNAESKKYPVIMITNFGNDENVSKALSLGAEDFILKYKIVPSEVGDKVDSFFGVKKEGVAIN